VFQIDSDPNSQSRAGSGILTDTFIDFNVCTGSQLPSEAIISFPLPVISARNPIELTSSGNVVSGDELSKEKGKVII
jgi:hypothetical protein